jgi:hypothetical protein
MAKLRIPTTTIDSDYIDGDVLYGQDINKIIDVFREGVNQNKIDINKLLMGSNYEYIAEDLLGLQELAFDTPPADEALGFIFDGNQVSGELEMYRYNEGTLAWDFVTKVSMINPYVETINLNGHEITFSNQEGEEGLNVQMNDEVTLQVGQEMYFYAKAVEYIANGAPVQFYGAQGGHLLIANAKHIGEFNLNDNPEYFIGVATQEFSGNGVFGYVTVEGIVNGLDTDDYEEGQVLWFNPENGGYAVYDDRPPRGKAWIRIATVTRKHTEQGSLFVRPSILEGSNNVGAIVFSQEEYPLEPFTNDLWFSEAILEVDGGADWGVAVDIINGGTFEDDFTDILDGGSF